MLTLVRRSAPTDWGLQTNLYQLQSDGLAGGERPYISQQSCEAVYVTIFGIGIDDPARHPVKSRGQSCFLKPVVINLSPRARAEIFAQFGNRDYKRGVFEEVEEDKKRYIAKFGYNRRDNS